MATHDHRELIASMLDGYLMAATQLSGAYGEFSGSATLVLFEGRTVEVALRDRVSSWDMQLVSIREGARWTEVEGILRRYFLPAPLGDPALAQHPNAAKARHELAWHATDLIMFLSPAHEPLGIYHLQVERPGWASQVCAVCYEDDALLVMLSRKV